jgi:general secretion pathway protein D
MQRARFGLILLLGAAVLMNGCAGVEKDEPRKPLAAAKSPVVPPTDLAPASAAAPSREGNFPGTGRFVRAVDAAPRQEAAAGVRTTAGGDVMLNYTDVDVRQVMHDVLGELLKVDYVIDPKVQGTVTLVTGRPLSRGSLLPVLETALRANGFALTQQGSLYRVLPADEAAKAAQPVAFPGERRAGPGVRILPLKFASAGQLQQVLQPFLPPGGALQADGARNVLVVSGARSDLDSFADLVDMFDVDWIAGTSYGIYPLKISDCRTIAKELEQIFADPDAPSAGMLRIVPIERLNSLLVISTQKQYLNHARQWIERLDYGNDETTPKLFHYYVQNSRAVDLASVLNELLSSGGGGSSFRTAPGTTATAIGGRSAEPRPLETEGGATGGRGSLPPPPLPLQTASAQPAAAATASGAAAGARQPARSASATAGAAAARRLDALRQAQGGGADGDGFEMPHARVVADEKNNALVVYARPRDYRMIEEVIQKLDVVPVQVMIEATIAEVTLNDELKYGLQWFFRAGANRFNFTSDGAAAPAPIAPGFSYVLSGANARAVLSALSTVTDVNVLSSPQLLVVDHQTAVLQVGDQVPVPSQQVQSTLSADAPLINSIEYRDTGVVLQVSPRVSSSGVVTLEIGQEVSDVAKTTSSSIDAPTIQQRRITSTIVVEDGETVALGGLIKDNVNDTRTGIPLLQDIPVAGALFRTNDKTKTRTELLVLLQPRVVRNAKEAQEVTDEIRARMQAVRPIDARTR